MNTTPAGRGSAQARSRLGGALPVLAACTLALSGCGSITNALDGERPHRSPTRGEIASFDPLPRTAVVCIDASGSYEEALRRRAQDDIAEEIARITGPGMPELRIHVRRVGENSYSPNALLATLRIPTVRPEPRTPDLSDDPLRGREKLGQHRLESQRFEAELSRARQSAREAADTLKSLEFEPARASDITGCFQAASERFGGNGGEHYVVVASDLEPAGSQQVTAERSLSGAYVSIVYFACHQARVCGERRSTWTTWLESADASRVRFLAPGDSLQGVFGPTLGDGRGS